MTVENTRYVGETENTKEHGNIHLEEEAVFLHKRGKYYLIYEDFSTGINGARTVLKIDPEKEEVILFRHKPAEMKQIFAAGERREGLYVVEAGELKLETETSALQLELSSEQGMIGIDYRVYLNGSSVSRNELEINFIEKGNDDSGK